MAEGGWYNTAKGLWTKTLIPVIQCWVKRPHRKLNYFLTQALTGHESFRAYTISFKSNWPECIYCGQIDTAEHTLFYCERWTADTPNHLILLMTRGREDWELIDQTIIKIMRSKENEEIVLQQQQHNQQRQQQ